MLNCNASVHSVGAPDGIVAWPEAVPERPAKDILRQASTEDKAVHSAFSAARPESQQSMLARQDPKRA